MVNENEKELSGDGLNAYAPDMYSGLMWDEGQQDQFFKTARIFTDPMTKVNETYTKSVIQSEKQLMDISIIFAKGQTSRLRLQQEAEETTKKDKSEIDYTPYSYAEIQVVEYLRLSPSVQGASRTDLKETMVGWVTPEVERGASKKRGRK
tara:strand:+ start:915 stop:1364 length:450 start_codon:yes stop_codon:yes gene_type:complete